MEVLFYAILLWLHLTATVIWVGGIVFVLFVAIPSSRQALGKEAGRVMGEISGRFTPLANYSIITLFATGAVMLYIYEAHLSAAFVRQNLVMALKVALALVMTGIHLYRGSALARRVAAEGSEERKAALQRFSLNLVRVNLALGAAILLLASAA